MSINLNNYEIYFIDYFDGNLTVEEVDELMRFIEKNPELKQEFDDFENVGLEVEKVVFDAKSSLKKTEIVPCRFVNEENYENSFIAYFEGDLNEEQKAEVEEFVILNASLEKEFEIFGKLNLPQEEVLYEDKASLKKRVAIVPWQYSAAIAASIVLFFGLFWFLKNENSLPQRNQRQISLVQPMEVNLPSNTEFKIEERELSFANIQAITVESPEPVKSKDGFIDLTAMKSHGDNIAVTGEVECIRLLTHNMNSDYLLASVPTKEKGLLAKIFNNNVNKLAKVVTPESSPKPFSNSSDPAFVKLLAGSVDVFNTITGSDVGQLKVYDKEGNLKNYKIETDLLTLNKTMN